MADVVQARKWRQCCCEGAKALLDKPRLATARPSTESSKSKLVDADEILGAVLSFARAESCPLPLRLVGRCSGLTKRRRCCRLTDAESRIVLSITLNDLLIQFLTARIFILQDIASGRERYCTSKGFYSFQNKFYFCLGTQANKAPFKRRPVSRRMVDLL